MKALPEDVTRIQRVGCVTLHEYTYVTDLVVEAPKVGLSSVRSVAGVEVQTSQLTVVGSYIKRLNVRGLQAGTLHQVLHTTLREVTIEGDGPKSGIDFSFKDSDIYNAKVTGARRIVVSGANIEHLTHRARLPLSTEIEILKSKVRELTIDHLCLPVGTVKIKVQETKGLSVLLYAKPDLRYRPLVILTGDLSCVPKLWLVRVTLQRPEEPHPMTEVGNLSVIGSLLQNVRVALTGSSDLLESHMEGGILEVRCGVTCTFYDSTLTDLDIRVHRGGLLRLEGSTITNCTLSLPDQNAGFEPVDCQITGLKVKWMAPT